MGAGRRVVYLACAVGAGLSSVVGAGSAAAAPSEQPARPATAQVVSHVSQTPAGRKVVLTISADIDGRSVLTISGRDAVWHHLTQAAPGRHFGGATPTKIGKASWMPSWPAKGENRDCGCNSSVFHGVSPPLPKTGPIEFKSVACREVCSAVAGDGKAVITMDDDRMSGSVPYVVTLTYTAPVSETHIKGRVTDSFREGVDNVRVTARGKGGTKTSITSSGGYYDIQLAKLKKPADYTVSAYNIEYKQIDPKKQTVTARPGKDAFAAFKVATGILRGSVKDIPCGDIQFQYSGRCSARQRRAGAVVQVKGSQLGKDGKFTTTTEPEGEYQIKVPVGTYKVRVTSLDVSRRPGARVCKEDLRLPVIARKGHKAPTEVPCVKEVEVTAAKGARTSTNFVAVPRRLIPIMDLLTWRRGAREPDSVDVIKSGLVDGEKDSLFGTIGDKSDEYPTIHCRSGCAVVDVRVYDLFGASVKGAQVGGIDATPIDPAVAVTPGNETGRVCRLGSLRGVVPGFCSSGSSGLDRNGHFLAIYAAPGVVPGDLLDTSKVDPRTLITATVSVKQRAPTASEPNPEPAPTPQPVSARLTIKPNQRAGVRSSYTLTAADALWLNVWTDPLTVKQGLLTTLNVIPTLCDDFEATYVGQFLEGASGLSKSIEKRVGWVADICSAARTPKAATKLLVDEYADKPVAVQFLRMFKVPTPGLLEVFGVGFNDIPESKVDLLKVVRVATEASTFLAEWLRSYRTSTWRGVPRATLGLTEPLIKAGERISFQIHEVTHYAIGDGVLGPTMTPQPAVYLSLASRFIEGRANLLVTRDYDPVTWLSSDSP